MAITWRRHGARGAAQRDGARGRGNAGVPRRLTGREIAGRTMRGVSTGRHAGSSCCVKRESALGGAAARAQSAPVCNAWDNPSGAALRCLPAAKPPRSAAGASAATRSCHAGAHLGSRLPATAAVL